jgi:hypothetical protein
VAEDLVVGTWVIERAAGEEDPVTNQSPSAARLTAEAQMSFRTARRALAKARTAGYLGIERLGSGRGKPTHYRLTLPPERLRHDRIGATLPRRQAR